jgi:hypothetical protein
VELAPWGTCTPAWSHQATRLTCTPTATLSGSTTYTVTLTTRLKDGSGNALASPHSFSFTTTSTPDTTPPTVASISPAHQSIGVSRSTPLSVTFSEPMDRASVEAAVSITLPEGTSATTTWSADSRTLTLVPQAPFFHGTQVAWQVAGTARDVAGNALGAAQSYTFRTVRSGVTTLTSTAALDGHAFRSAADTTGASAALAHGDTGDDAAKTLYRTFLSFDLGELPADTIEVTGASLTLTVTAVTGTPSGTLYADSVVYGPSLEGGDFDVPTVLACVLSCEELSFSVGAAGVTGARTVTVTDAVWWDWNMRQDAERQLRSQFRLRLGTELKDNAAADFLRTATGEATASQRPTLRVTYDYP